MNSTGVFTATGTPGTDASFSILASDIPTPPEYTGWSAVEATRLTNMNTWLGLFDALPYHTKTDLGEGEGHDVDTPNIFEYRFGNAQGYPVLIDNGMHATEAWSIGALYWLCRCLCKNNKPVFQWLRRFCDVRVIPFLAPQAYRDGTYTNANSVNINRNSSVDVWGYSEDAGNNYAGAAAGDQAETSALEALFEASDAPKLYINLHQTGAFNNKSIYLYLPNQQFGHNYAASTVAQEMANRLVAEYDASATCGIADAYYAHSDPVGYAINYAQSLNIQSLMIENDAVYWADDDTSIIDATFTRALTATLASIIYAHASNQAAQIHRPQVHVLGATSQAFDATSYKYIGPDGFIGGMFGTQLTNWTRQEQRYAAGDFSGVPYEGDPGAIRVSCRSTVVLTMSGRWHSDDTGNSTLKLFLYPITDGGVFTGTLRDALSFVEDVPATASVFPTRTHVYRGVVPGVYGVACYGKVSAGGTSLIVDDVQVKVEVIPTPDAIVPTYAKRPTS